MHGIWVLLFFVQEAEVLLALFIYLNFARLNACKKDLAKYGKLSRTGLPKVVQISMYKHYLERRVVWCCLPGRVCTLTQDFQDLLSQCTPRASDHLVIYLIDNTSIKRLPNRHLNCCHTVDQERHVSHPQE